MKRIAFYVLCSIAILALLALLGFAGMSDRGGDFRECLGGGLISLAIFMASAAGAWRLDEGEHH